MHQLIKYTVIIPHKNVPHLLDRCLKSIPDVSEIQVIVVDDNSDPFKVDLNRFPGLKRSNTQFHFMKEGGGAGFARNVGLRHAKGKWLIFADSDDFFNDCFVGTIAEFYESDADVIYFSATSIDSSTMQPGTRHMNLQNAILKYDVRNSKSVDDIKYLNWEPWSKMFNRAYIERNLITFDEIMVGNDLGFVLKAGHYSRKIRVNKSAIYCATFRSDSLSFDDSEAAFDNRYYAVILINTYMKEFNKNYLLPLLPHIYRGRKYGLLKVVKMILIALKAKNNTFYQSRKYLLKFLRQKSGLLRKSRIK